MTKLFKFLLISLLFIALNVFSQGGSRMLSDKEKEILKFSKEFVEEFVRKIESSGDPEKLDALDKLVKLSKIKTYAISKTLAVAVGNCTRIPQGNAIKQDFDKWVTLAKDDISDGFELIKNGFEGSTYEEMEASTIEKMAELENEYSNMDETALAKE